VKKIYLFIEPEIVEEEGVIYRHEKCGAIESCHIIILHPQFPKKRN
jgi:predicted metalloprotease